jgi:hypothetical protein
MSGDPIENGARFVRRHLALGWWFVLAFLALGFVLEALHGLKIGWYLSVTNTTRRLMWTLAHAHGTLAGLVNIAFALTLRAMPERAEALGRRASPWLVYGSALLPAGFFLGGIVIYSGDPGVGIVLVPAGAIAMGVGLYFVCRAVLDPAGRDEGR